MVLLLWLNAFLQASTLIKRMATGASTLLSEVGIYLQKCRHKECDKAARHHDNEEHLVAHEVLYISRHHAGKHESEIGNTRTDGIMRCPELALTVKKHVKREHGEAESVAELLYKEARRHHQEIGIVRCV